VSFVFKKSSRLLNRREFQKLYKSSTTISGKFLVLDYSREDASNAKMGITVTKKFGKAHERNRFKRVVREAFRKTLVNLPSNIQLNIRPRYHAKEATSEHVLFELKTLLESIIG